MALTRFSVSLEEELTRQFDDKIKREGCPTRSKAVGDLIRASLVQSEWQEDDQVAGAVVLVYDHHTSNLLEKLTQVQHDYYKVIISTQHIHLDHDNCLEIVAVRGRALQIKLLVQHFKSIKGLKHVALAAGTTGAYLL